MSQPLEPSAVFRQFNTQSLQEITNLRNIELKSSKKADFVKTLSKDVTETGVKQLISMLKKTDLQQLATTVEDKIDFSSKGVNRPDSSRVLSKRLTEHIIEVGVDDFLADVSVETLKTILTRLGVISTASDATALVKIISKEVNLLGFEAFFGNFSTLALQHWCNELGLAVESSSKPILTSSLIYQQNYKAPPKPKPPKISKNKPAIKKGISYDDIFNHYWMQDIRDFCSENGLKVTGKKRDLILRILAWLDGDVENTLAGTKKPRKIKRAKKPQAAKPKKVASKDKENVPLPPEKPNTKPKQAPKQNTKKSAKQETKPKVVPKAKPVQESKEEAKEEEQIEQEEKEAEETKPKAGSKTKLVPESKEEPKEKIEETEQEQKDDKEEDEKEEEDVADEKEKEDVAEEEPKNPAQEVEDEKEGEESSGEDIQDKVVVLAGSFTKKKITEIKKKLASAGAKVKSTVTEETDYVIVENKDAEGVADLPAVKKASEFGTIIEDMEFIQSLWE